LTNNINGKPCISYEEFKKLAYSELVQNTSKDIFINFIERWNEDEKDGKSLKFKSRMQEILQQHKRHIMVLENIHSSYRDDIDIINNESALAAAYLLNAKVINLLHMACFNLEQNFLNSALFRRLIDETIDLAEYFLNTETTEKGNQDLLKWFKENIAPSHFKCRQANSKAMGQLLGEDIEEAHEESMYDLYQANSKSIHPTYTGIVMTLYRPVIENRKIVSNKFEYAMSSNYRELYEMAISFQSSIWSTVQSFILCFEERIPLKKQDVDTLLKLDKFFLHEVENS